MSERLLLKPRHRRMLEEILREHVPGVEVWAYGSRVSGQSHGGSDLDLVLRGPDLEEIPIGQARRIRGSAAAVYDSFSGGGAGLGAFAGEFLS